MGKRRLTDSDKRIIPFSPLQKGKHISGIGCSFTSASASLDYAVRRAVLTSVNQTAGTIMDMKANEISHDLMETTAHYGARPEHAVWQGQVVSRSGQSGYLSLSDVGYGEVTGIFGANCRHNWFMYFGYRTYTGAQLEDMKNKTVTYNGKEMSVYDATQKQRGMERAVKKSKRKLVALDEALKNLPEKERYVPNLHFTMQSAVLKRQEARLSDFCWQTGLRRDKFREQVFSTETENGIKQWTKSVSQKAVMARRNVLTNAAEKAIIVVKDVRLYGIPYSITQVTLKKGGIDRNYYGADGKQYKQISNHDHGHKKESVLGEHGEHAHDYYLDDKGIPRHKEARELTADERKENSDIL